MTINDLAGSAKFRHGSQAAVVTPRLARERLLQPITGSCSAKSIPIRHQTPPRFCTPWLISHLEREENLPSDKEFLSGGASLPFSPKLSCPGTLNSSETKIIQTHQVSKNFQTKGFCFFFTTRRLCSTFHPCVSGAWPLSLCRRAQLRARAAGTSQQPPRP